MDRQQAIADGENVDYFRGKRPTRIDVVRRYGEKELRKVKDISSIEFTIEYCFLL